VADEQVAVSETAAPSEQPAAEPVVSQSETANWRASLPDSIRGHKSLESIADVGSLAKGYVHAQSLVGTDKIPVPGKWATDDDWNHVYSKLGKPETIEGYSFETPEGAQVDPDMMEWFKGTAHKAGLNPGQAQNLFMDYLTQIGERQAHTEGVQQQAMSDSVNALRQEWGQAYDQRVNFATQVFRNFGADEVDQIALADGSRLGDNPGVIKLLSKVGQFMNEKMGEDSIAGLGQTGVSTPDEAQAKLREVTAQGSPYWNAKHPEHKWYVDEALRLREQTIVKQQ
jgi:hypothetical protein